MLSSLMRNKRGQASVEMLFVFPLLLMLFTFIVEMGFLMYDWAVINYQVSTAAVRSATTGQFNNTIRTGLAQNLTEWTVNGRGYVYNVTGTDPPGAADDNTVYIYGTNQVTNVQRGQYISVNLDYPWHFRFFLIDNLFRWVVDQNDLRLRVNAMFPSEVFFE